MRFLERLRANPLQEILDPNELQIVADKLLNDLKSGYIGELFEGKSEEESFLRETGFTVVLKKGKRYYIVSNHSNRRYPKLSGLSVREFLSLPDSFNFDNVQRFVVFHEDGQFGAHRGYGHHHGWSRLDLNMNETKKFLRLVKKADVDMGATRQHFTNRSCRTKLGEWTYNYRWPRFDD